MCEREEVSMRDARLCARGREGERGEPAKLMVAVAEPYFGE